MEDAYAYFFHGPRKFARPIIEKSESKIRQQDHNDLVVFQRNFACVVLLVIVVPCVVFVCIIGRLSTVLSSSSVLRTALKLSAKDTWRRQHSRKPANAHKHNARRRAGGGGRKEDGG
jgi:hypothetical protein